MLTRLFRARVLGLVVFIVCPVLLIHHWLMPTKVVGVRIWYPNSVHGHRRLPGLRMTQPKKLLEVEYSLQDLADHPGYRGEEDEVIEQVNITVNPNAPQHHFLANGLVVPNAKGQHPIFDLVACSRTAWQEKLDKASITLDEAVREYRRRYHRAPPKGFDRWWAWAEAHDVRLPDEYDQIHTDLEPFFALTSPQLAELRAAASEKEGMFSITCNAHNCSYTINEKGLNDEGKFVARQRAQGQLELIKEIQNELEDVTAVFYSHDVPWQFVGHDYKDSLEEAAAVGEYYEAKDDLDTTHVGWASACAPNKPLRSAGQPALHNLDGLWNAPKSFVWDHKAVMDPCMHPDLTQTMGFLSGHGKGPRPSVEMFPVMSMCKTFLHSDVLGVQAEGWTEDVGEDPKWDDKPDNRLLWRGKTTGIFFADHVPWNISQRINLVQHSDRAEGFLGVMEPKGQNQPVGPPSDMTWRTLNRKLMDVKFVDEPIQCDPVVCKVLKAQYGFGNRKDWSQANQYKYQLDLDGNGWSARFKRLMSTNSAILKSTIFPEWYSDRIQPWVHYIPIKPDLTDLYDVMVFFQRDNDRLAREIALRGKQWSKTFWRKEDMVAYQFRLLLELARLMAPDRDAASYEP